MVEIAKAFRSDLSVLILDEPTASLTNRETDQLFALIEQSKAQGVGIIYITHRMAEIRRIGDRITVLRDGRYIATVDAKTASEDELVELMTGRVVGADLPAGATTTRQGHVLRGRELSAPMAERGQRRVDRVCEAARSSASPASSVPASREVMQRLFRRAGRSSAAR